MVLAPVPVPVAVVDVESSSRGCQCGDSPQTFRRAMQVFQVEVRAGKKRKVPMGQTERDLAEKAKPLLREALRETLQAQADGCPPHCPVCGAPLRDTKIKERTVRTQWGEVTLKRTYGYCERCGRWVAPADAALGLEPHTQNSPDLAEKIAYLGTKVPAAEAAEILEHLAGERIAPSRVERQVRRTSQRALEERRRDVEKALSTSERFDFARQHGVRLPEAFSLIILMDAWMIRERDDWGLSESLRRRGVAPQRWHEAKTARLFRIEASDWHEGSVPSIAQSAYVATRGSPEVFSELVWTEALRCGLLRAKRVIVVADGAVWLWNLAQDRFPHAEGTLDFYHASQHLWSVAHALFGEGSEEARQWVTPLGASTASRWRGRCDSNVEGLGLDRLGIANPGDLGAGSPLL